MMEQIAESALHIIHPVCGCEVLVIELELTDDRLAVEAICWRCNKYVGLELTTRLLASNSPLAIDHSHVRLSQTRRDDTRGQIEAVLRKVDGNVREAAKRMGYREPKSLYSALRRLNIDPNRFRPDWKQRKKWTRKSEVNGRFTADASS